MDNLPKVKLKSDLYGLVKVDIDHLVYCIQDNSIYHLKDISRRNKPSGWELVAAAVSTTIINNNVPDNLLTRANADSYYVKYQTASLHPTQTIYGDVHFVGNISATGNVRAYAGDAPQNWWNDMPAPTVTSRGGIMIDNDTTHYLRGDGNWAVITSGTFNHAGLNNLDYANSGHTGFAATAHTHDDRYFTETETNSAISTAIANLVDTSPATLDTLNELAAALGDDPNFATTVTTAIGLKAPIASPTFTGTVSGITKAMVGLGNVDNESKVTMFTNPQFTGGILMGDGYQDRLYFYNVADNVLGAQVLIDGETIGTCAGDAANRLILNPLGGNIGIGTINPGSYKLNVAGTGYFSGALTSASQLWGNKITANNAAHIAGANDYNLELYSDNTGDGTKYVSLRFHQGSQYWNQIRCNGSGFRLTGGADDLLAHLYLNNLIAGGDVRAIGDIIAYSA